jgi:LysM domain
MPVSLRGYGGARRQARRERDVRRGIVRLHCLNPPLAMEVRLGQDLPQLTGGFGGWETTQRPRAVGMTTWQGVPPFELSVQILLGGAHLLNEAPSQEDRIRNLINVARGTRDHVPGIVYIDGIPGLPADRWVISGIEWGDAVRNRQMERIRQMATITFLEYQPPEYETLRKGSLAKAKPRTVRYTVKKGDTPAKIAKHRRGDWKDIREVNRKGVIKKANQQPRKGTPFHVGAKINVTLKDRKPRNNRRRNRQGGRD